MISAITTVILAAVWAWIQTFWLWLVGGSVAILGLLFSPTLRKYTLGAIAVGVILTATYVWGYNSNHNVTIKTHQCEEFRKHLVTGPATDKAIRIFKNAKLCEV